MTDSLSGFTGHHVTHAEEPPPEPSHRASEATRRYEFRRSGTDECIQWIFDRKRSAISEIRLSTLIPRRTASASIRASASVGRSSDIATGRFGSMSGTACVVPDRHSGDASRPSKSGRHRALSLYRQRLLTIDGQRSHPERGGHRGERPQARCLGPRLLHALRHH